MAYPVQSPRFRLGARVSVLTLIAVGFAGCSSDVTRFDANPFASSNTPPAEVTGSVPRGPAAPTRAVESRPLSQPTYTPPPRTSALPPPPPSHPNQTGVASGAAGMGSYRPPASEVTGSLPPPTRAAPASIAAQPAPQRQAMNHGGQTITVQQGDTLYSLSRRHHVSVNALKQANGINSPNALHIGQRLTIPSQQAAGASQPPTSTKVAAAPATVPATPAYGGFHVAGPGDTLSKIARRYRVSLNDLAKANRMKPYAQLKPGERLVIPATSSEADRPTVTPQVAAALQKSQPATQPAAAAPQPHQKFASLPPAENANLAKATETPAEAAAESGSALFRWPVRGRIVAAFGAKPNGQQNDGINISVPEGTPVKAAEGGEVAYAGNELKGYGNLILIRHPNGFVTAYAHASELLVKRGDKVKRGQVIAKSGQTGNIGSPQLHFEIRKGSTPVDPAPYLGA
jgi:murein DD-endopeptidase MepM/ murein hydrolase activator NlpD